MPRKSLFYELSAEADADLDDIFEYTYKEFGLDQAVFYFSSILDILETLPLNPKIGRERNEIRNELHSILHGKHIIFYRMLPDRIRIVRILHGSRDLPRYF